MSDWLKELRQALDAATSPLPLFFRDDDAGWSDDRLLELLDLFAHYHVPIDVAAIPDALTFRMATELRARIEAEPDRVAIHQHGFAHQNHEPEGHRKCEFGVSRGRVLQEINIEWGKHWLIDLFGPHVAPIFTPPWNRCTETTAECLRQTGFRILSRDRTAAPLNLDGLFELPVTIDWFAQRKGVRLSLDELGAAMASAVRTSSPLGIMFHHALMDEGERRRAGELLDLLASHHNAHGLLMDQLATNLTQVSIGQSPSQPIAWQQSAMPALSPVERN
jgi:peptidoglycan/xylan/chitin deacetylase (PgdA/CDA1 family)